MKIRVISLKKVLILVSVIIIVTAMAAALILRAGRPKPAPAVPINTPFVTPTVSPTDTPEPDKDYIKWVDYNVPFEIMDAALSVDVESQSDELKIDWIDILAYLGAKCGGEYKSIRLNDIYEFTARLKNGESIEDITSDMKYFSYYKEAYSAVLDEYVGEYSIKKDGKWVTEYGLKVFSPIAEGYDYSHYDDFGVSRSYGYKRRHLGHDMMGRVGTPIIAVESGKVECLGWNQYGGWRIGIRSFDKKRYYYYAHLRKGHPYHKDLKEGNTVKAGDVIGYLGMTGYSAKENVNNIDTPHLHFGVQLIFDESQKDGTNQIWIDLYDITRLLQKHRATVEKNEDEKEFYRKYDFKEPIYEGK